jgi:cell division protein FtsW
VAVVALCLIGLVFVLSASAVKAEHQRDTPWYYFLRQAGSLVIGAVAMWIGSRLDHKRLIRLGPLLLVGSIICLTLVLTPLGNEVNGAKRWLGPSFVGFQPSEVAKLGVILWLAGLLSRRAGRIGEWRDTVLPAFAVVALIAGLVMAEPDLGTTALIFSVAFVMLVIAGCRLDVMAGLAVPAVGLALIASMWGFRRGRMLAFLDPWKHANRWGFQTLQSQVGLASGGVFGVGLGQSRAKWGFLPEAHTDFIFSIIGEELGLVGCTVVIALFLVVVSAGVLAGRRAADLSSMLVAVGISTWIGLQALFNIGVAVGALPNKGITLPFVSYGGTSLIVTMFAAGILLNIARHPAGSALRDPVRRAPRATAARG